MKTSRMTAMLAIAGAVALVTACADDDDDNGISTFDDGSGGGNGVPPIAGGNGTGDGTGTGPGPTPGASAAVFNANEIASIVFVINQGEVAQAELAQQKAVSPEVRSYADRMATEHTQAIQRIQTLGQASPNDPTAAVLARHEQLIAQDLGQQSGPDFDVSYMTAQVGAHAKALSMIDRALLPSAANVQASPQGDLRAELTSMRQAVEQHLDIAVQIHGRLRGVNPGGPEIPVVR